METPIKESSVKENVGACLITATEEHVVDRDIQKTGDKVDQIVTKALDALTVEPKSAERVFQKNKQKQQELVTDQVHVRNKLPNNEEVFLFKAEKLRGPIKKPHVTFSPPLLHDPLTLVPA